MIRIGRVTLGMALGCAGLSPSDPSEHLLVMQPDGGECRLERVTPGREDLRVLGVVPGACAFPQVLLAPDGSRLLLGRFPMAFVVDLESGQVHALPALKVDTSPALPDPTLHLDGQGALWEVVLGEGEAEYDSEGWPAWRALRYQLHVLRAGSWVVESEHIDPLGVPNDALRAFQARFSSDVVMNPSKHFAGEAASAELRRALDEVAGTPADGWEVQGQVAQPVTRYNRGWPLLRVGDRWQALPERNSDRTDLELGQRWLMVHDEHQRARVYSLSTGELVWTGPTTAELWPESVPAP